MPITDPSYLPNLLDSILAVGCECLEGTVLGRPKDCKLYHGDPPGDCCFAAETEIVTSEGVRPIGSLVGRTVELMTTDGQWVHAPVRSFGVQPLRRIVLRRHRQERVIFATGGHRWLLDQGVKRDGSRRPLIETVTDKLSPGDVLPSETGEAWLDYDAKGVAAGIVFGDGTLGWSDSRIVLYGPKVALADRLTPFARSKAGDSRFPDSLGFAGMPVEWKQLPEADGDRSFLLGWLMGYVATDGCVNGKAVRLGSAKKENLERVREIAYRLGIATSEIGVQMRKGFLDHEAPLFSVSLHVSSLPDDFLIRGDQQSRRPKGTRALSHWKVVSVEETERVEEVFCATVPETRAFVLAGNILTGNCDYLAVWLERIRPTKTFPQDWAGIVRCGEVRGAADIALKVMRPCWPVLKDNPRSPFPPAAETDLPTTNLLIDAMALWCCLLVAGEEGKLNGDGECVDMRMGGIDPNRPQGGCAGWTVRFSVELESCC